jgi:hypothetical protein
LAQALGRRITYNSILILLSLLWFGLQVRSPSVDDRSRSVQPVHDAFGHICDGLGRRGARDGGTGLLHGVGDADPGLLADAGTRPSVQPSRLW